MTYAVTLVRLLPLPLVGRLAVAFTEITLALAVVSGSIVLGHDLREWRTWWSDSGTQHPWAPTPKPSMGATATAASQLAIAVATPATTHAVAAPLATPTPACHTSASQEELAFMRPQAGGADCVWLAQHPDGTHLVVETHSYSTTDLGIVAMPRASAALHAFAPSNWSSPVLVVTGPMGADASSVIVFSWQTRGVVELFRAGGKRFDVSTDGQGWPRVSVTTTDGTLSRVRTYGWNGSSFVGQ